MKRESVARRFWKYVDMRGDKECWLWTGSTTARGYGQLNVNGRPKLSHRISYELHHGPIPPGLFVLHSCDNPPCVHPAHLRCGTPADNTRDMVDRLRDAHIRALTTAEAADALLAVQAGESQRSVARRLRVSVMTVHRVVHTQTYRVALLQESR